MLVLKEGTLFRISDDRVSLIPSAVKLNTETSRTFDIKVDGLQFISAVPVYLEHVQYKAFHEIITESVLTEMFGTVGNFIFMDIGLHGKGEDGLEEFKDYTAKAKEGINYFEDVITPEDKNCEYKDNYIEVEVRI